MIQSPDTAIAIPTTDSQIPAARLERDAADVLETVYGGGVGLIPLDVAYALVGHTEGAVKTIFSTKKRSYEKPNGMLSNAQMSDAIHILPDDKRRIIHTIIEKHNLPFSVVAPFDASHPFFKDVDPFVMQNSTKVGTLDMLLNAGQFHNELARQAWGNARPIFGSSANISLTGSNYRLQDIEEPIHRIADISIDHGTSKYVNDLGRSSSIIDFRDFSVIRVGVIFDRLEQIFRDEFGITLKVGG